MPSRERKKKERGVTSRLPPPPYSESAQQRSEPPTQTLVTATAHIRAVKAHHYIWRNVGAKEKHGGRHARGRIQFTSQSQHAHSRRAGAVLWLMRGCSLPSPPVRSSRA
ncbi:hypothetical protein DQ04_26031000, partial [Trypanosoma grayi]|uniref:hypothetical protein n=1 Tax=Trypanosoma grayi TaxID=71804 RepID=UPI0004F42818